MCELPLPGNPALQDGGNAMRLRRLAGMGAALAAIVVLGAGAAVPVPPRSTPAPVSAQQAEDPALLRELAERLLARSFPAPPGDPPRVRLLPGALPAELPFELPLPPGSRLVGSAVQSRISSGGERRGESIDVVLDAPGAPDDVIDFYDDVLAARGWFFPGEGRRGGGFQPTLAPSSRTFCGSESGPVLFVTAHPRATGPNDVRIRVETGTPIPVPCGGLIRPPEPVATDPLPPLFAPPGVQLLHSGGSATLGGPGMRTSDAIAETEMPVPELEAHFARQLVAAGWTRLDGRADGPLAWSTWAVPGEGDWQGFLYVLAGPGPAHRSLHVQATSLAQQTLPGEGIRIGPPGP